jgi:regulator of sirC expression with transglutaminase-like and TPR domain
MAVRTARAIAWTAFCALSMASPAGSAATRAADPIKIVRELLATPDSQIDFAKAKLTIDKLVDPRIDVGASLQQIDRMVSTVGAMAGPNATTIQRLAAVRRFIYVDGDWNGHRPFRYDMTDLLGAKIVNKLLPTYIATRRGNCVSMPILFLILADRLGVHVTLSTAPFHLFVKYVDDKTGKVHNLETTSGGYPARDIWLRHEFPMTDEAIKNGVYLKTLSRKETLAVMAELLLEQDMTLKRYRETIGIADVILRYYPSFANALLDKGSAYAGLIDTDFKQKYRRPVDIPPNLLPVYETFARENELAFRKAEALGWRVTDGETAASGRQQALELR